MPSGYSKQDLVTAPWARHFNYSHVTLFATFEQAGSPVQVDGCNFKLKKGATEITNYILLKPPTETKDVKYEVTFLTNGLDAGDYSVEFSGTYGGSPVLVNGDFNLYYVPRTQWFIDTLRSQLGGYANLVPREYLVFDPTEKYWEDGKLYQFLQRAIGDLNMATPPTTEMFTLDSVPVPNLVLLGAELYALTSIGSLEIAGFFDISVPMRVNLYKGDKYQSLANFINSQYSSLLAEWKKQYIWGRLIPIAITMSRIPMRVLRPVSMTLHFSGLLPF